MTARALVRVARFDPDTARESLRHRAATTEAVLGGRRVRIFREPLFKRAESGALLQSLRIDVDGSFNAGMRAVVRTPTGTLLTSRLEPGPAGIRVLVPEVDTPTAVQLELPDLAPGATIDLELR